MRWWTRLGLWPRMALALSAGFLLLFGAFTVLGEYALRGSERETRHEYQVIARMTAAQFDARIARAHADLQRTGDALAQSPGGTAAQEILSDETGRAGSIVVELAFLDTSGRVIAIAPPGARLDPSLFAFPEGAPGETPPLSGPFADPATGHPAVAMRVPVQKTGPALGTLVSVLSLDSAPMLEPLQQAVQIGQTGHAALIDARGYIIVSTLGLAFDSTGEHPPFFEEVMSKRQDEVKIVPFALHMPGETTGEQHLMAAAMLQQAPWGVSVGGDVSEAFAPARHLRWGLVILGSLALAAIWGGSLWGTRLLVAPVYSLMRSATRIAGGDLTVPLAAGAGGEIGEMGEALERMRQRLLQTIQSLEELRATLEARVRERTEALQQEEAQVRLLLHQVITAQEEERARIAYELHDEVGQLLTAIRFSTDGLSAASLDDEAAAQITRVRELIDKAMADLRRLISGLRPGVIDQLGLLPALREVSEQILAPLDIAMTISGPSASRLPGEVEVVLFRIAQEAMHNIARHSGATQVELTVTRGESDVAMRVHDNGRGFDPATVGPDQGSGRGLGLVGMRERAALLGGWIRIDSAPEQGTTIEARLPSPRAEDDTPPKETG